MIKRVLKALIGASVINNIKNLKYRNTDINIGDNVEISNTILNNKVGLAANSSIKNSEIDMYTSIGRYTKLDKVKVGKFCSISWDVSIGAGAHPFDHISTHAFPYVNSFGFVNENKINRNYTVLGNDVWIGCNSVILEGVQIGDGAIIGAGAVVTKDVPPYTIVAGIPARFIKYRFSNEVIEKLSFMKWWNYEESFIKEHINHFNQVVNLQGLEELERKYYENYKAKS